LVAAAAVGLAACGSASTTATPASAGATFDEDLTFTGQVAGHAVTGTALRPSVCGKQPSGYFAAVFKTPLNGTVYQVSISISSGYTGPGTYPTASQNGPYAANPPVGFVMSDTMSTASFGPATEPQLVVDADEMTGTIDGDYVVFEGSGEPVGHVTGRWRCG
jgi:hypothetical protein